MCGIAGLVHDPGKTMALDHEARARELRAALVRLEGTPLAAEVTAPFEECLDRLEAACADFREQAFIEALFAHPELQELMRTAAAALRQWEEKGQAFVLAPGVAVSTEFIERWNALWVRSRDLAWVLERDVLCSLERSLALLGEELRGDAKARYEAWKIGCILENIGRLEVRGRDSLGISAMITFDGPSAWETFCQRLAAAGLELLMAERRAIADHVNGAILVDSSSATPSVMFTLKVAQEVGALGDNVARIVESIRTDAIFWEAVRIEGTRSNILCHTRWASNGIISEPNCHPVSDETLPARGGARRTQGPWILAALNGDVDNYQQLVAQVHNETGESISPRITTDTKIIPVVVAANLRKGVDLRTAFCQAVSQFEGSIAVVMHSTADPHRTFLALRGSGQAMFVGVSSHGYVFASELYGVVEQTSRFLRMDGTTERVPGKAETTGQVLVLDDRKVAEGLQGIECWSFDGHRLDLDERQLREAEITTRDINRGQYEHFLLKEISESPLSIEKTLRGKFFLGERGSADAVRMNLGEDVFPAQVAERLRSGQIRRIFLIGQGTAAIAGIAVASMMERALDGAPLSVRAIKASELSGYSMSARMDDSLVVAISQSGTTTDTNRTVDLARSRGASAIAIVNRRNSDLVYKADGVLYTSDGRDIEMSVASTKAFYSQVVAGYLISLHMALILETLKPEQVRHELEELRRVPDKMRSLLADHEIVRTLAERFATTRRDWAVVGSGSTRAAAEEIRIKLSELCYKSIATDFIEDKKHIDLSSEPLTLVCVAGLGLMALKDAVKEVAIFKSHKSIPIVICSEGFDAFEPYAAGVIYVPRASENASVLLNTLVGHLWGYYCARAIDRGAAHLRGARATAVQELASKDVNLLMAVQEVAKMGRSFQDDLARGSYNSSLSVETASQLTSLFQYLAGGQSLRQFSQDFQAEGTPGNLFETLVTALSRGIHELSRPIDAIKHQAKTVTVGISRLEEAIEGTIFDSLRSLGVSMESLPYRDLALLRAISPAVSQVKGATLYEVQNLGSLGEPLEESTVKAIVKTGLSQGLISRADAPHSLVGTKEAVVRNRRSFVGLGRKDQRPIVIVPILPGGQVERLALMHLEFQEAYPLEKKVTLLRDTQNRYDDLKAQVTETDLEWDDSMLASFSVADLVVLPVDKLAERIIGRAQVAVAAG